MTDQPSLGSAVRAGVFLRTELTDATVLPLWLGFGPIDVPVNPLDVDGETYAGLGALTGIPVLQQLINGVADRVGFTLSGGADWSGLPVLADAESDLIDGGEVNVGVCRMDDAWQLAGDVLWLWRGRSDKVTLDEAADDEGARQYTVSLSVSSGMPQRSRPDLANWSDAQHQIAHPGDPFFANAPKPSSTKRWPGG